MNRVIQKLIFSDLKNEPLGHNVLSHQFQNAKDILNNNLPEKSKAIGIERILKIALILSQFLFLGIYVRAWFGKYGKLSKHVGVEFHVLVKLIISFLILVFQPYYKSFLVNFVTFWSFYMILETLFYTANLLFSEDVFAKPHSHKRNLILIIIDYITLNVDFANLYLVKGSIKAGETIVEGSIDALYFTFVTSLTIGYGDFIPTPQGRLIGFFKALLCYFLGSFS